MALFISDVPSLPGHRSNVERPGKGRGTVVFSYRAFTFGTAMGKRDTRYAFMNPIAMARLRGPSGPSGPTIKDYLSRNRPTWEEVKRIIEKKKQGSSTLAAWEEHLNSKFEEELRKNRERVMAERASTSNAGASSCSKSKKRRRRSSSSSSSSSSSTSTTSRSRSSSPAQSSSASEGSRHDSEHRKRKKRRHKHRSKHRSKSSSGNKEEHPATASEERTCERDHSKKKRKKSKKKHKRHKKEKAE